MFKNKKALLIAGIAFVAVCLCVVLAVFVFGDNSQGNTPNDGTAATYTIEVTTAGGIGLKDISIFVYEDSSLKELVSVMKTDNSGVASFTDVKRDTYVAVLKDVPTGYELEPYYAITGEITKIVLKAGTMEESDMAELTYQLGDAMMDFSVTAPDGTTYTLSDLFEGKKLVMLNFYYNECQPCLGEFPYLQEAYEAYKDEVAVLAMNPVNDDGAAIAALQKDLGVTFPMVACDSQWEKIFNITAYPTSVFIDRFGNICLIHNGAVSDAKTLTDAFAYFTADDYEQKLIEDIKDLEQEEPEGTKENPTIVAGESDLEITVDPGKVVYNDFYKVFNKYLRIENPNAYVIYEGKTYYPENGVVNIKISAPDTRTPATVGFGNSGDKTETFKIKLTSPSGTIDNPRKMSLGEFTVKTAAGNEQGEYYKFTATEDGTLTLQCLSAPAGVQYGFSLYNLSTYAMRNLESDAVNDPTSGRKTVSVQAKKGQVVQMIFSTLPDSSNKIKAATYKYLATFQAHSIETEEQVQNTAYTLTVKDDAGQPVPHVNISLMVESVATPYITGADGVANISLPAGTYSGTVTVPDGYTAAVTTFALTAEAPNATLTLNRILKADYVVRVQDANGSPISGVYVRIGSDEADFKQTNVNGEVSENLVIGDYPVTISVPTGYIGETNYTFATDTTELEITLAFAPGTQNNPHTADAYPFDTVSIKKNKDIYVNFAYTADMDALTIESENACVYYGETAYTPDSEGLVTVPVNQAGMTSPVLLRIVNTGSAAATFTVNSTYKLGTLKNPQAMFNLADIAVDIPADGAAGYYYQWTSRNTGTVVLTCPAVAGVDYDVVITNTTTQASNALSDSSDNTVSVPVTAGDSILIYVSVAEDQNGDHPALNTTLGTQFNYPTGSSNNPAVLTDISSIAVDVAAGNADGYYYTWTAPSGTNDVLAITCPTVSGVEYEVVLTNAARASSRLSNNASGIVFVPVTSGETITLQVVALADPSGSFPALAAALTGVLHDINTTLANGLKANFSGNSWHIYQASEAGTVTLTTTMTNKTYNLELIGNGKLDRKTQISGNSSVSLDLAEDEIALIHIYTMPDAQTGAYPTFKIRTTLTWAAAPTDPGSGGETTTESSTTETTVETTTEETTTETTTEATTEETTEETTEAVETAPDPGSGVLYTVTVVDSLGVPQSGVTVLPLLNGIPQPDYQDDTNAQGIAWLVFEEGVDLTLQINDPNGRYYDKSLAVLSEKQPSLIIRLYNVITPNAEEDSFYSGEGLAYKLLEGSSYVELGTGKNNYCSVLGGLTVNSCLYRFIATRPGTYQISINNANLEVVHWNTTAYAFRVQSTKDEGQAGVITISLDKGNYNSMENLFGVVPVDGVTNAIITVKRIGEPQENIGNLPWNETWRVGHAKSASCNVTVSGTPTFFNLKAADGTYNLVYDSVNGYYRLGSATGPVVLVTLGENRNPQASFVGLYERIVGKGNVGGSNVSRYFFDDDGKFVKKENYTDSFTEAFEHVGLTSATSVAYHPLTKDLKYALENGFVGWWTSGSDTYLTQFDGTNANYAWMFACCYVE